jgi:hypothetical protein
VAADAPRQFAIHVAAEAFRVRREQIEKDLKHGRFPNAKRGGPTAGWMIPLADLEAAGYKLDPRWQRRHAAWLRHSRQLTQGR